MRVSGKNFDVHVGDLLMRVDKVTLDIEDNSKAVKTRGVTSGYVLGDVSASGELEVDVVNINLLIDQARRAGGFRALKPLDMVFYANTGEEEIKVEAFGCLLKVGALLDIDSNGGEKHMSKIPFEVTSTDFVRINGVSYLASNETEDL